MDSSADDIDWRRNLIDLRRTVAFRNHRLIVNTPKSGKLRIIDVLVSLIAQLPGCNCRAPPSGDSDSSGRARG